LFRVLKSKLEHSQLTAPVTGLVICVAELVHAPKMQLSLDGDASEEIDPRKVAVLLAELTAEIGQDNVGVLEIVPVHRPETRTKLVPFGGASSPPTRCKEQRVVSDAEFPVRVLPKPVPFTVMPGDGSTVSIDHHLFTVKRTSQFVRFDEVEWWTTSPVCRDYVRVWLTSGKKNVEAWVFTDRLSKKTFVHGYFD
jgi:protein ImuB